MVKRELDGGAKRSKQLLYEKEDGIQEMALSEN